MKKKRVPHFTKEIEGNTVTGIFAVHGNIDDGGDMSINGSFAGRLNSGRNRTKYLWQHNSNNPPIATITEVKEVERAELPKKVLQYAPEATGGVQVTRKYYEGVPLAEWVLRGIKAGDIDEMSYAYDVHGYEIEEIDGKQVRVLKDIELFDISDVNWGMNPATAAVKQLTGDGMTFTEHGDAMESAVKLWLERVKDRKEFRAKEGRVLSAANRERIKGLVLSLNEVADDLQQLLDDTEPKAAQEAVLSQLARFRHLEMRLNGVI